MGIFDFFKKQHKSTEEKAEENGNILIPEKVFIEKIDAESPANLNTAVGIQAIYNYLKLDFESKGFNDALVSPDEKYKQDNLKLIKYDLEIILHQVKTYHDSMVKEIDFHISSRSRAGLVDLVEELQTKKADLLEHMGKVYEIDKSLKEDTGLFERAILAYQRGFTKGLSSITQSTLLMKEF
ncbi:hypothetical protein ACL9RF_01090 [Sphingobacterium sp. Mn56C]|uniref:hypothetical protein n=1 Tax=Sphingobacterium sp. Mn56C TaxID=3395261 RepID=UPI003BBC4508